MTGFGNTASPPGPWPCSPANPEQAKPAKDVFRYRYGDYKDKATLLIAMLNAVGVRATWVLVDTHRGFIDPLLPSIQGNHAIAAIEMPSGYSDPDLRAVVTARSGKRYLIFDPTDPYTPIGLLGFHVQGSYGILVAGNDSQVVQLPTLAPDADLTERAASFTSNADATLRGTVTETRSGEAARGYRRLYTEEGEKQQLEAMQRRLQKDLTSFTVDSSHAQNAREMSKNVVLEYSFTASGYAQSSGDLLLLRPRFVGRDARPTTKSRVPTPLTWAKPERGEIASMSPYRPGIQSSTYRPRWIWTWGLLRTRASSMRMGTGCITRASMSYGSWIWDRRSQAMSAS